MCMMEGLAQIGSHAHAGDVPRAQNMVSVVGAQARAQRAEPKEAYAWECCVVLGAHIQFATYVFPHASNRDGEGIQIVT